MRWRDGSTQAISHDRDEWIVSAWLAGLTLREIGEQHGVTRERVRQIVRKRVPPTPGLRGFERYGAGGHPRQGKPKPTFDRVCRVCWRPFTTTSRKRTGSCSKRCRLLWMHCRQYINAEQALIFRGQQARYSLNHPEHSTPERTAWAKRFLAGKSRPPRPYNGKPGSKLYAYVQEVFFLRAEAQRDGVAVPA